MDKMIMIVGMMFFAVPLIALFDYLMFMPYLKETLEHYKKTGKIEKTQWIPACVMESLFFLVGLLLGAVFK